MRVELGRDAHTMETVPSALGRCCRSGILRRTRFGGIRSPRAARSRGRRGDRQSGSAGTAFADAVHKDPGFDVKEFEEMVARTIEVRDDLWPLGSDPDHVRSFVRDELLTIADPAAPSG